MLEWDQLVLRQSAIVSNKACDILCAFAQCTIRIDHFANSLLIDQLFGETDCAILVADKR